MDAAKITLSEQEQQLVVDASWILTKNRILGKAFDLLATVQQAQLESRVTSKLPVALTKISAKISQGENYRGLPYRILDFPRLFGQQDRFAIRSFFWWGNFFSTTLHLKGLYVEQLRPALFAAREKLAVGKYAICTGPSEWEHHFESGNYQMIGEMEAADYSRLLHGAPFIKIAKQLPVAEWDHAPKWLLENYEELLGMLSFPADGTGL